MICVFGDSLARGVVLDDIKKKYVFLQDSFVNLFSSAKHVDVKNFSKFGCTVCKGEELVEKCAEQLKDYDFTVLEFGGNDCDLNWAEVAAEPDREHQARTPLPVFISTYKRIIEKIKKSGGKPVILSLPPLDAERFFRHVSAGLCATNILRYLGGSVEYIYRWHEMYNNALFGVASSEGVPLIDIRSEFLADRQFQTMLCADGMHPNARGHSFIARILREFANGII